MACIRFSGPASLPAITWSGEDIIEPMPTPIRKDRTMKSCRLCRVRVITRAIRPISDDEKTSVVR